MMLTERPLFIGEAPGSGYPPGKATPLFPYPKNCAGERLQKMTGLSRPEYLRRCVRINLLPWYPPGNRWPTEKATMCMANLQSGGLFNNRVVVFVGKRVAEAYLRFCGAQRSNWDRAMMELTCSYAEVNHGVLSYIPHPSGRNLWYNDPDNKRRVELFLRKVIP